MTDILAKFIQADSKPLIGRTKRYRVYHECQPFIQKAKAII